jgi:hypothetical protein
MNQYDERLKLLEYDGESTKLKFENVATIDNCSLIEQSLKNYAPKSAV